MTDFDIEIRYKKITSPQTERPVKPEVKIMIEKARKRWLEVVKGGFVEYKVPELDGTEYKHPVIEFSSTILDGVDNYMAINHLWHWNPEAKLPVHSHIELDSADVDENLSKDPSLLYDSILHEIGHSLGIDKFIWDAHNIFFTNPNGISFLTGDNCRREYQKFASLSEPTDLPLFAEDGALHIDEYIFPVELMSPAMPTGGNKLSKLSAAMLDDIGYTVDYTKGDSYDAFRDWKLPDTPKFICGHSFKDPYLSSDNS